MGKPGLKRYQSVSLLRKAILPQERFGNGRNQSWLHSGSSVWVNETLFYGTKKNTGKLSIVQPLTIF
jgi:hypothetical protein